MVVFCPENGHAGIGRAAVAIANMAAVATANMAAVATAISLLISLLIKGRRSLFFSAKHCRLVCLPERQAL